MYVFGNIPLGATTFQPGMIYDAFSLIKGEKNLQK